ncbi:MAG: hypothetical protein AAF485_10540 [Chloroflexota bacterium]
MEAKWHEWHDSVLQPLFAESGAASQQQLLQQAQEKVDLALLAADTDQTQTYVMESARLPEIRGASNQLRDANERLAQKIRQAIGYTKSDEDPIIFAGGGGLLALLPTQLAAEVQPALEALFPRRTTVATVTVDWRAITPQMVLQTGYPQNEAAPFGTLVQWASTWLNRRKENRAITPFVEALPFEARCNSCYVRPVDPSTLTAYPDEPICRVCHDKRAFRGRDYWFRHFQKHLDSFPAQRNLYYEGGQPFPRLDDYDDIQARWTPQDLTEISAAASIKGAKTSYVGFIYLDGDSMGSSFERIKTPHQFRQLSQTVTAATQLAVMRILANHLHPAWVAPSNSRAIEQLPPQSQQDQQGRMRIHPFEIITLGGDDIILIVPADKALPIALDIIKQFQADMAELLAKTQLPAEIKDEPFTLSGGVVLASDHNPVRILNDLAEALKKQAKKKRKQGEQSEGCLDFMILKSADLIESDLSQLRDNYPYMLDLAGQPKMNLLKRPYYGSTLTNLWDKLIHLRRAGFSNSQMHALAEALLQGRSESSLFYLYQEARDRKGLQKHLSEAIMLAHGLTAETAQGHPLPWFKLPTKLGEDSYQTALWDLAELYDFIPR